MATIRCKCGTVLRDDGQFDHLLIPRKEFDIDSDPISLLGKATEVWQCWTCERLWVFWGKGEAPTEYQRLN